MQMVKDCRIEGQRRDTYIINLITRYSVLTSDLLQLALSRERFDLPGQSPQAILNRLTALAARDYIHRLGRSRTGHIVYAAHKRRKGVQPQLEHDLLGSRFIVHLELCVNERGLTISDLVTLQRHF